MCFEKTLELWKKALVKPKETFKKERKKANLGLGAKYILVAGAITGFILGISSLNLVTALLFIIVYPLMSVASWLFGSGVNYIFARLLGGNGDYTTQSYLVALYAAPFSIITVVIMLIPVVGVWLTFLVSLYGLYLLTLALKETHKYSTGRAVLTWLLPMIIITIVMAALVAMILMAYIGTLSPFPDLQGLLV